MKEESTYRHLPSDPCLTKEQMFGYLDGTLTPLEQNACERHMADCEMCSDALEGLESVKDRAALSTPLPGDKVKPEAKIIPIAGTNKRLWYAAAASLVVILGTAVIFNSIINNDDSQLADHVSNNEASAETPAVTLADSISTPDVATNDRNKADVSDKIAQTDNIVSEAKSLNAAEGDADAPITAQEQPPVYAVEEFSAAEDENYVAAGAPEQINNSKTEVVQEETQNKTRPGFVEKAKSAVSENILKNDAPKSSAKRSELAAGSANEGQKKESADAKDNYSTAPSTVSDGDDVPSVQTDSAKSNGPSPNKPGDRDLELSYINGLQLYNAGQYNAALVFFDEVINYPAHSRFQDAEFQKANTLIKLNRKEEAKVLLKSIEAKKGVHAAEAAVLLKSL